MQTAGNRNRLNTIVLLSSMATILSLLGWTILGTAGLAAVITMVAAGLFFSPQIPSKIIMRLYGARPVNGRAHFRLYSLVETLAVRAGLNKIPQLFISPQRTLNAFAAGSREDPAIALTPGILQALSTEELCGILSHEISHLKNNDTKVMILAGLFHRLTHVFSSMGLLVLIITMPFALTGEIAFNFAAFPILLLAPTCSMLLQLALSRTKEFEADRESALLLGSPYPLARALQKLESLRKRSLTPFAVVSPIPAPPPLFNTHPNTEERINRLLSVTQSSRNSSPHPDSSRNALHGFPSHIYPYGLGTSDKLGMQGNAPDFSGKTFKIHQYNIRCFQRHHFPELPF